MVSIISIILKLIFLILACISSYVFSSTILRIVRLGDILYVGSLPSKKDLFTTFPKYIVIPIICYLISATSNPFAKIGQITFPLIVFTILIYHLISTLKLALDRVFTAFKSIPRYIKNNSRSYVGLFFEGILTLSFIIYTGDLWLGFLLSFIWFLSGVTRTMLETTDFIFEEREDVVKQVFQFYGASRILFYILILWSISYEIFYPISGIFSVASWLPAFLALGITSIWHLIPYYQGSSELMKHIKILRFFGRRQEPASIENISDGTGLDREYIEKVLEKYTGIEGIFQRKILEKKGRKYQLSRTSKTMWGV